MKSSMLNIYRGRWKFWLPATFAAVALSFIVGTILVQFKMMTTDRAALVIAEDAAPSVERLSTASIHLRHLQAILERDLDALEHGGVSSPEPIDDIREHLERELDHYLDLPFFDAERSLWLDVADQKRGLDMSLDRYKDAVRRGNVDEARATLRADVTPKIDALAVAISRSVALNASQAHDLALQIQQYRRASMREAYLMDAISTLIAVGGVLLLSAVVRAHAQLLERHTELERERASELEQFAGRVAHDILSPLNTAACALELASANVDARRKELVARGSAALQRVRRLVDGLLDFARAGASPDPDAEADVAAIIEDVSLELRPTAVDAGIELQVRAHDSGRVKCHPGVLTSLVSNLARNAIKYIGDGLVRRVEIRALDRGDYVRVEVDDTGPGLAPDMETRVFEPYARGRNSAQPGIGLGLATVKRLAESHGGSVGVRSVPGRGCQFWFELPKAVSPITAPAPALSTRAGSGA